MPNGDELQNRRAFQKSGFVVYPASANFAERSSGADAAQKGRLILLVSKVLREIAEDYFRKTFSKRLTNQQIELRQTVQLSPQEPSNTSHAATQSPIF